MNADPMSQVTLAQPAQALGRHLDPVGQAGEDVPHGAEGAGVDQLLALREGGDPAVGEIQHEAAAGLSGCLGDGLGVGDAQRHRLLQQDVLAGPQRRDGGAAMQRVRQGDHDRVHVAAGQQVVVVRERWAAAQLLLPPAEQLFVDVADRGDLGPRLGGEVLKMAAAVPADSDHTDPQPC